MFGAFSSDELIGEADVPLSPLITQVRIGGNLDLMSNKKGVGGSIRAFLKIRLPLNGEVSSRTIVHRDVFIDHWPPIQPIQTNNNKESQDEQENEDQNTNTANDDEQKIDSNCGKKKEEEEDQFSVLNDDEKEDPHSFNHLESNDVMEKELETIAQTLLQNPDLEEEEKEELISRQSFVSIKLQILVAKVQQEQLSLEGYGDLLSDRIKRDKLIALFLKNSKNDVEGAIKVMHRIKIMEKELRSFSEVVEEEEEAVKEEEIVVEEEGDY